MTSYDTTAVGKKSKEAAFEKFSIGRVRTSDFDVDIDIKYCGLCHTDLHLVKFKIELISDKKFPFVFYEL